MQATMTANRTQNTRKTDTMKAIVQEKYGSADVLELREIIKPQIADDEVLLRVHAAGVDRGVWHLMTGLPYLVRIAGFGLTRPKTPTPGLDLSGYDGVIIGASIHLGKYQPYMLDYARRHGQSLSEMPAAFFSVCLTAAGDSPEERAQVAEYLATWTQETGWEPALVGSFAGALRYTQYGFIKRFIMRGIAKKSTGDVDTSRDYEYTDWESVAEFATNFLMLVHARQEVTA